MVFRAEVEETERGGDKAYKIRFYMTCSGMPDSMYQLTWEHVLNLWQYDPKFTKMFCDTLTGVGMDALFWETVPLVDAGSASTIAFECTVINAGDNLKNDASATAFNDRFSTCKTDDSTVISFPNKGNDAMLVAPCPHNKTPLEKNEYNAHLSTFLRGADKDHRINLWKMVSTTIRDTTTPRWISTDGSGVPWLHVRLDTRPKYYKSSYKSVGIGT